MFNTAFTFISRIFSVFKNNTKAKSLPLSEKSANYAQLVNSKSANTALANCKSINVSSVSLASEQPLADKKAKDKTTQSPSPFMQAVWPLFKSIQYQKQSFTHNELLAFTLFISKLNEQDFRNLVKSVFTHFGYQVELVLGNNTDLNCQLNGNSTLVRCIANEGSIANVMVRSLGVNHCEQLHADMAQHNATAGVLVTAGKIYQHAFDYCRQNQLFGIAGYDLLHLAMQSGLLDAGNSRENTDSYSAVQVA